MSALDDWRHAEIRRLNTMLEVYQEITARMKADRDAAMAERDALKADAERYRYLRANNYKQQWPNSEFDHAMHLSFSVSGIWSNNLDPAVLDGCIDTAREMKP